MKLHINDISSKVAKVDDRYVVKDNNTLNELVVSSTDLFAWKSTTGHRHAGQEEVYYFIRGNGRMELDDDTFEISAGDVVLIKDGVFHRVYAGSEGCYFVCVFDGKKRRH
jgi:mannose-6-phosphate isomerase-like protein (cupin superfamily)